MNKRLSNSTVVLPYLSSKSQTAKTQLKFIVVELIVVENNVEQWALEQVLPNQQLSTN
jgi:hypothetical protein